MSKELEKILSLERELASERLFGNIALALLCTIVGLFDLLTGALVSASILLVLGILSIMSLPKSWNKLKNLKTLYREIVSDSETE